MTDENLWGKLPEYKGLVPPSKILYSQAAMLTKLTNSALVGEIRRFTLTSNIIHYSLRIRVPVLDNYMYELLDMTQPIDLYPASISAFGTNYTVNNEKELIIILKKIFSLEKTQKIISALLAQIEDHDPKDQ